jgi:uncharacterized protein YcfJ
MKKIVLSAAIAAVALSMGLAAQAQPRGQRDYGWHGDAAARNWDAADHYRPPIRHQRDRRLTRKDEIYRGHDGRYYCRRSDGSTGLVVGAVVGGLLGNSVGGDTLSTLLGAAGGAAVGTAIDRGQVRCR